MTRTETSTPSSGRAVHFAAGFAILLAALLVGFMFLFLTPIDQLNPELRQRDDNAVSTIRLFGFGVIALGTIGAGLASARRSFHRRPKASLAFIAAATLVVLAAVFEIFQTIGI